MKQIMIGGYFHYENPCYNETYNGTDDFGFSALPGSIRTGNGSYGGEPGDKGYWWSGEFSGIYTELPDRFKVIGGTTAIGVFKQIGASVRCIKD